MAITQSTERHSHTSQPLFHLGMVTLAIFPSNKGKVSFTVIVLSTILKVSLHSLLYTSPLDTL